MKLTFYELGIIKEKELKFAVISAEYQNKWVFVRHKERDTWEIPGGRRESDEDIISTAKRELFEETGAKIFELASICDYSMSDSSEEIFGRLLFAKIIELEQLPDLEINELKLFDKLPRRLTYQEIQPFLFAKTLEFLNVK